METNNGYSKKCFKCGNLGANNIVTTIQVTDDEGDLCSDSYVLCDECYNKIGDYILNIDSGI